MVLKYIRKLFAPRQKTEEAELPPLPPLPPLPQPVQPLVAHRPIPKNLIDPDVVKIIHRLTRFGQKAYIVGGGVRDLLLHRTPKDFDIGTSALPQEVKKLFRNCRIIGRRFRLAHIFFRDKIIEVATFRANVLGEESINGADLLIRSDNVFGNPETDALRRDFTINALFYDVDDGNVIDYVGGLADLDSGVLRTIGDPDIRMREDPIRILRALRLAGRLGFRIDEATLRAIRDHRTDIHKAAVPRILEDLLRMLRGSGAEGAFRLMWETGVLEIVLPEISAALADGAGDKDHTAVFWKALHAIDLATARGTEFSNPTLFAALLYPRVVSLVESSEEPGGTRLMMDLDKALAPAEQRLNVPRRDRDRIRQILLAQRRFVHPRRGRRFSPSSLISRPFFPEAFDLFEILCSVTGQHKEDLRRWRERIASFAAERGAGARAPATDGRGGARVKEAVGGGWREHARERSGGHERPHGRGRAAGGRGDARGRRGPTVATTPEEVFGAESPDRPDLSEEDIALVYGTVLAPEVGASSVPAPDRSTSARMHPRAKGGPVRQAPGRATVSSAISSPSLLPHPPEATAAGPSHDNPIDPTAAGGGRKKRRRRRGGRKHRRHPSGSAAQSNGPSESKSTSSNESGEAR